MASLADIILQGGRDQANSALQLAQIEADRRNANAQNITHSIATLADVFGKIPQQIAQNKRQAVEDQTSQLELDQKKHAVAFRAALGKAITDTPHADEDGVALYDIPAITKGLGPDFAGDSDQVVQHLSAINQAFRQEGAAKRAVVQQGAQSLLAAGADPKLTLNFIDHLNKNGSAPKDQLDFFRQKITDDPASTEGILRYFAGPQKTETVAPGSTVIEPGTGKTVFAAPSRPVSVAPGASLVNPDSGQPVYSAPAAAPTLQSKDVLINGKRAIVNFNPKDGKMYDPTSGKEVTGATPIPPVSAASNSETGGNAKDIADAIASGDQPPTLTGLYRLAGPVRAELARSGYNLTKATEDWTATQKYLNTLNGAQQVRLRQAVEFTTESIPLVRQLISEWDSSGLPYLSKANLEAAAKGTYGDKQQSLAVRLKGQIADITSELGTVYKGGNSSTDESLKLAAENLQGDWSKKAGLDALDQIEKNLTIRSNSIKNTGVVGNSDNAYAPKTGAAPSSTAPDPKDPLGILK